MTHLTQVTRPLGVGFAAALLVGTSVATVAQSPAADQEGPLNPRTSSITKLAIVAPEEAVDYGWNQQGVEGARTAAAAIGAELDVADGAGYDDPGPIMRQMVDDGAQFLIAHAAGYNTAGSAFAQEFDIPVLIGDAPELLSPGLVATTATNSQEGAYLAGVLAALTTKTETLGIVISADTPNWHKQSGGFVAGARSVNPTITIRQAQIGAAGYADAAGGKSTTEAVIAAGADIIFGMGDGSSFGMLQAVETATPPAGAEKVWFIDVIGDKTPLDTKGVLLSSVLWDFSAMYDRALMDYDAGTYGTIGYTMDAANGGIRLLETPHITPDAWAAVEAARARIADGSVNVPVTSTQADVDALIAGQ